MFDTFCPTCATENLLKTLISVSWCEGMLVFAEKKKILKKREERDKKRKKNARNYE